MWWERRKAKPGMFLDAHGAHRAKHTKVSRAEERRQVSHAQALNAGWRVTSAIAYACRKG